MTRLARIVIPGLPHHVTQRGNRRERVFFSDDDYQFYQDGLRLAAHRAMLTACGSRWRTRTG